MEWALSIARISISWSRISQYGMTQCDLAMSTLSTCLRLCMVLLPCIETRFFSRFPEVKPGSHMIHSWAFQTQENIRVEALSQQKSCSSKSNPHAVGICSSRAYTIYKHIQIHANIIFTVVYGVAHTVTSNYIMRLQASFSPNSRTTWPNWANHLGSLHPWVEGLVKLYNLSKAIASGPSCLIWNWIAYHRFSFLSFFSHPNVRDCRDRCRHRPALACIKVMGSLLLNRYTTGTINKEKLWGDP